MKGTSLHQYQSVDGPDHIDGGVVESLRSLAGPVAIALMLYAVLSMLSHLFIGEFDEMFQEFGLRLRTPTAFLLGLSRILKSRPFATLLTFLVAAITIALIWRTLSYLARRLPVVGQLFRGGQADLRNATRLCETAAVARESIDDRAKSLDEVLASRHSSPFRHQLRSLAAGISNGSNKPPGKPKHYTDLPANFSLAFSDSMNPSDAVEILRQAEKTYRRRLHLREEGDNGSAMRWAILWLGLVVMFVVMAMFAPMLSLVSGLG